jgi:hypothetical protein
MIRNGSVTPALQKILDDTKPEAVYFTEFDGHRGAIMIVDLPDPSKVPAVAEPWFLLFNAEVHFHVVITPADLEKVDFNAISKKWAG